MAMLKKLRERRGITQRAFADQLGIRPETLCRIESGAQDASETLWRLMAIMLETDAMTLRRKTFAGLTK